MKASEIRKLTVAEIEEKISEARHELMNIRFQTMTGQVSDTSQIRYVRRDIARMETILKEKELAEESEA
ncbi:MAG: 50S ribosomal protein L29 [Anaerolineaceae bacterium]|jgi:large subunit ribosomal protein L29|nr:50S ribosomal protein L29 [Anaerolineaceae bacterium]